MSGHGLVSGGQRVAVATAPGDAMGSVVQSAAGQPLAAMRGCSDLVLDRLGRVPARAKLTPLTRGVWRTGDGVLVSSVGGSGFTQLWRRQDSSSSGDDVPGVRVSSRWSPSAKEAAAARLLPQRHRSLRAQVLLHYPVLWTALAMGGGSPLHVSMVDVDGVAVLLAGPGGVGKSTLVADALAHGARAVCDNLAVSDGRVVHGVVEPLRLPAGVRATAGSAPQPAARGPRAAHGRFEHTWSGRLLHLRPDLAVVVRRDDLGSTHVRRVSPEHAASALVAGTYAAGELQRFWPLVAHLALAGLGPVHPPLRRTARRLTSQVPCYELTLGREQPRPVDAAGGRLAEVLADELSDVRRTAATPITRLAQGGLS